MTAWTLCWYQSEIASSSIGAARRCICSGGPSLALSTSSRPTVTSTRVSRRVGTIVTTTSRSMGVLLTAPVDNAVVRRRVCGGVHHRLLRAGRAKRDDHILGFSGTQSAHGLSMVLAPLVARLVVRVAQAAGVPGGLLGTVVPAIPPPPGRVTPTTDDEGARTPPASNLSARRVLVHMRTPWWCERREELGRGKAVCETQDARPRHQEGSGDHPGLPSLRRPLRRALPRLRTEGRLLGTHHHEARGAS